MSSTVMPFSKPLTSEKNIDVTKVPGTSFHGAERVLTVK